MWVFYCFIHVFCEKKIASSRRSCLLSAVSSNESITVYSWWRHQMETFPRYWSFKGAGNSPATDEFPSQRPVMRSFDVLFDLGLNNRLGKHSWRHRVHYDVTTMLLYFQDTNDFLDKFYFNVKLALGNIFATSICTRRFISMVYFSLFCI